MTIDKDTYIQVLENEITVLKNKYFKPHEEGTGHFNTAISVLKQRIEDILHDKG